MNEHIRARQVRLVGSDGEQKGVFTKDAALKLAKEEGLDLVQVDPHGDPPVCKILDYGKYKYQKQKKQHEQKKLQKVVHLKEVKLRPNIDDHDLEFKLKHVKRFLEAKDKVKVTLQFRGREMQHKDRGEEVLNKIRDQVTELGEPESTPKMAGRSMTMILVPHK